jgi:hypothetical protein
MFSPQGATCSMVDKTRLTRKGPCDRCHYQRQLPLFRSGGHVAPSVSQNVWFVLGKRTSAHSGVHSQWHMDRPGLELPFTVGFNLYCSYSLQRAVLSRHPTQDESTAGRPSSAGILMRSSGETGRRSRRDADSRGMSVVSRVL